MHTIAPATVQSHSHAQSSASAPPSPGHERANVSERASAGELGTRQSDRADGATAPVQRDTGNASTAGQRASAAQMRALSAQQEEGYRRVGLRDRVKLCGTVPVVRDQVGLGVTPSGGVQVCGLARCGSRWCPHCWGLIAAERGEDIRRVADWAQAQGYTLALVTLTAAHVQTSLLEEVGGDLAQALMKQQVKGVFDGLCAAWRYVHSGRAGKALAADRVGYARAFELTTDSVGVPLAQRTGTHGHFHVMLVLDSATDTEEYRARMWERWQRGCEKHDLAASEKGFDFKILQVSDKNAAKAAASYLIKGEQLSAEKIGLELTRSDVKEALARTSPEGLLRQIGRAEEVTAQHVATWRGIEDACAGRRWLTWSRDLRDLAGLGDELTDDEIVNAPHAVEGDQLAIVQWDQVRGERLEEIKKAVGQSRKNRRWETLLLCLDTYGVRYRIEDQAVWSACIRAHMRRRSGG